ncbi:MAG TPA: ABC transporter permease [Clostridia bacterium]|nr:ABC transporter permease [Clostridia bacterium]
MTHDIIKKLGLPRIIIIAFVIFLFIVAGIQGQNMATLITDSLTRFGMNLVFSLAMLPAIMSGIGLNMGLPIGIVCGLLGGLVSIEAGVSPLMGLIIAICIAIVVGFAVGVVYGKLLNRVKGSEMLIGNYLGSCVIYLMCMFWFTAPFKDPAIIWPMGGAGIRTTVALTGYYEKILLNVLSFKVLGVTIPTGMLIFGAGICALIYFFSNSKTGVSLQSVGNNPSYANAAGINVNRARVIGAAFSTALGALGIIVYAQSYGFFQMYEAPLTMSFVPMAAVLLGGATLKRANIWHAVIGTFLFQTMLTIALPVANQMFPDGDISEMIRIMTSNGIILYALAQAGEQDS